METTTDSIRSLQSELKLLDLNGWLTLEDDQQNDEAILRAAIAYIRANS